MSQEKEKKVKRIYHCQVEATGKLDAIDQFLKGPTRFLPGVRPWMFWECKIEITEV